MKRFCFTQRETEVAILLGSGLSNSEIANRLFISIHTVSSHIKSIHLKVGTDSRSKLVSVMSSVVTRDNEVVMKVNEFKTFIGQLDEQHHLLITTIGLIESKMSSKFTSNEDLTPLKALFKSLDSRLKKHFRSEEEYHKKINFIGREKHREEHLEIEKMLDASLPYPRNKKKFKCLAEILEHHLLKDYDIVPPPAKS